MPQSLGRFVFARAFLFCAAALFISAHAAASAGLTATQEREIFAQHARHLIATLKQAADPQVEPSLITRWNVREQQTNRPKAEAAYCEALLRDAQDNDGRSIRFPRPVMTSATAMDRMRRHVADRARACPHAGMPQGEALALRTHTIWERGVEETFLAEDRSSVRAGMGLPQAVYAYDLGPRGRPFLFVVSIGLDAGKSRTAPAYNAALELYPNGCLLASDFSAWFGGETKARYPEDGQTGILEFRGRRFIYFLGRSDRFSVNYRGADTSRSHFLRLYAPHRTLEDTFGTSLAEIEKAFLPDFFGHGPLDHYCGISFDLAATPQARAR